jgi:hypothetical protein
VGDVSDLLEPVEERATVVPPPARRRPSSLTVAALAGLSVGLALALAVAVFDTGGGADARAAPCRLLNAADIGAIVGSSVESGRPTIAILPEPGLALCGYRTSSPFGEIVVGEQRPGRAGFVAHRQQAERHNDLPGYQALNDLGDPAFAEGGHVFVLVNDTLLVVFAQKGLPEPMARQLAARAVSKLR